MTMSTRLKTLARDVKYQAQRTRGRVKQTAGKATGNDRLRREGKAEHRKSRLDRFVRKLKDAVRR
jgi:uncharacterized protein YjbJ (UPF0337 family)